MADAFEARVRAAAVAAWWTLLIACAFLTIQWAAYLQVMSARPEWAASLWGPDETWESIRATWLRALVIIKLMLWPLVLAAVWLALWARQLRRPTPGA